MTSQQADLYSRIRAFPFSPDGSTLTFEDRLAKENGWSRAFTDRAIEEYRRFVMLAATAGHPVSPPDAVDQVWHLHLLYTRSYWEDLCRNVLPRPLHHEPSTGGESERAKFHDWYANTIDSYRRAFGAEAPPDIWPAPDAPRRQETYRRVDVSRHWVFPRRGAAHVLLGALLVILLLALASGCGAPAMTPHASVVAAGFNPLDLRGPQFLVLYVTAFAVAMIVAAMVRSAVRGQDDVTPGPQQHLDPYDIACLRGGPDQGVAVAVTRLVSLDLLRLNPSDGTLRAVTPAPAGLDPLGRAVHRATSPTLGTPMSRVCSSARREAEHIAERLCQRGLLVDRSRAAGAVTLATLIAVSVPAVGLIKVFVGVSRGRPVGFLMLACMVTTLLALAIFARRPLRTRRGDFVLRRLEQTHAALRRPRASGTVRSDLPLAVAVFGLGSLSHTELSPLQKTLRQTSSNSGGSSGSGYASFGCGGGGSGSGGGGGGCGGCGGCGG